MYGIAGERRLPEIDTGWLDGYEGSTPVRIGNGAADQFQLDVYGEILDAASVARGHGMPVSTRAWALGKTAADFIAGAWTKPDEGIWETRGGRQHFVHSKVMAWVAMDRAATSANEIGETGDARGWRAKADEIHADILANGYDDDLGSFVQSYGSKKLDAALLQLLDVGFLPGDDPRMVSTVRAIQRELSDGPLVHRYSSGGADSFDDGLAGGEGSFLICSFWMVNALAAIGDLDAAQANFEALLDLRNDVGLLAEEFDARHGRMVGNFPQAFSHIGLISSADALAAAYAGRPSRSALAGTVRPALPSPAGPAMPRPPCLPGQPSCPGQPRAMPRPALLGTRHRARRHLTASQVVGDHVLDAGIRRARVESMARRVDGHQRHTQLA